MHFKPFLPTLVIFFLLQTFLPISAKLNFWIKFSSDVSQISPREIISVEVDILNRLAVVFREANIIDLPKLPP